MNASIITNFLKPFLPTAMAELDKVDDLIADRLAQVELQDGEVCAAYVITANNQGTVYLITACLNADDRITRMPQTQMLSEFLKELLTELM